MPKTVDKLSKKDFNIVIPCYNEENTIGSVLESFMDIGVNKIIVVNDSSKDNSKSIIQKYPVILLENKKNRGYGYSLIKGLQHSYSRGDSKYTIIADADLQHSRADLEKLIKCAIKKQPGIVYAIRQQDKDTPLSKRLTNMFARIAMFILYGINMKDPFCGLKIFGNDLIPSIQLSDRFECGADSAMFIYQNRDIAEPVKVEARYSDYSLSKGQKLFSGFNVFYKLFVSRIFRRRLSKFHEQVIR